MIFSELRVLERLELDIMLLNLSWCDGADIAEIDFIIC
jgi:hypothetical protein